jgi:hypothetical protein
LGMLLDVVVVLLRRRLSDIGETIPGSNGKLDDNVYMKTGNRGVCLRGEWLGEHVAVEIGPKRRGTILTATGVVGVRSARIAGSGQCCDLREAVHVLASWSVGSLCGGDAAVTPTRDNNRPR